MRNILFFSLIHSAYFICYISSNTANGLDELSGADNMEIEEGQGIVVLQLQLFLKMVSAIVQTY
jgi:hypothetical protein